MNKICMACLMIGLLVGCKTVDLEHISVAPNTSQKQEESELSPEGATNITNMIEETEKPEIVYIDRPVILPPLEKVVENPTGRQAAKEAVDAFVDPELMDGSASIRPYRENEVYRVFVQEGQLTDIVLEPGELIIGDIAISDKNNFLTSAAISFEGGMECQHITVKPVKAGLTCSIFVYTNRRTYPLVLYAYKDLYTPIVRWMYSERKISGLFAGQNEESSRNRGNDVRVDLRYLSNDYKMRKPLNTPYWTPEAVYDDGKKTYIILPEIVLQREFPGCFENKNDMLNYRRRGTIIEIDKLIHKITLKLDKRKITIWKKK